jgi:hypothetical protein
VLDLGPAHADGRHPSWLGHLRSALQHSRPRPIDGEVSRGPAATLELGVTSTVRERPRAFLR